MWFLVAVVAHNVSIITEAEQTAVLSAMIT